MSEAILFVPIIVGYLYIVSIQLPIVVDMIHEWFSAKPIVQMIAEPLGVTLYVVLMTVSCGLVISGVQDLSW